MSPIFDKTAWLLAKITNGLHVTISHLRWSFFSVFGVCLVCACVNPVLESESVSETVAAIVAVDTLSTQSGEKAEIDLDSGLVKAVREAVLSSKSFKSSLAVERSKLSRVDVAQSVRKMQFIGNSTVGGMREQGGTNAGRTTTGASVNVNLSQIIYDGGQSSAKVNVAAAEAFKAGSERKLLANDLALDAAKAWIDCWQYQTRLLSLQERTAEMNNIVSQMERMASNGMIDRSGLDGARRQILDISFEEMIYKSELEQARINFIRFFNYVPNSIPKPNKIRGLAELLAQPGYWRRSPIFQKTAAEIVIASNSVKAAQAAFEPRARIQGGLMSPMKKGESTDTSLGVVLQYTFGDGGKRAAQLKEAEAGLEAAKSRLQDVQTVLDAELKSAMNRLDALKKSMPLIQEKILLSKEEAKTARSQLTTGQSDLRKLIDAKLENYRAEDRLTSMQAEKLTLEILIAAKSGALSELIGLENS